MSDQRLAKCGPASEAADGGDLFAAEVA